MADYSLVAFHCSGEIMENVALSEVAPNTVNSSVRTREYLTEAEIERLMAAARKSSRYGHRNATMILLGYRHGLRASELCDLSWSQVELNTGRLHVRRAKNGSPSVHPLQGDEIRALRRLQREQGPSSYIFMTERDGPMTPKAFHALFGRIGVRAGMPFPVHPHMLRHGCGYALAMPATTIGNHLASLGQVPNWRSAESPELEERRRALATPGRPGVRKIAERFGVDPGTVQRISRPFGAAVPLGEASASAA
jgi:Phage integrase family